MNIFLNINKFYSLSFDKNFFCYINPKYQFFLFNSVIYPTYFSLCGYICRCLSGGTPVRNSHAQVSLLCNLCNYLIINVHVCLKKCTFRNITNYWFFCKNTLFFCTFWCIILIDRFVQKSTVFWIFFYTFSKGPIQNCFGPSS